MPPKKPTLPDAAGAPGAPGPAAVAVADDAGADAGAGSDDPGAGADDPEHPRHKYEISDPELYEDLVAWYKSHPELWDARHPGYRMKRRERDDIISDKAREVNMTGEHLKGWLRNQTDKYVKVQHKLDGGRTLTESQKRVLEKFSFMRAALRSTHRPQGRGQGPPAPAPGPP